MYARRGGSLVSTNSNSLIKPPPAGCKSPLETHGVAKSCRVCYSMLMSQWDEYVKSGVPLDKRVYWLKRNNIAELIAPPPPSAPRPINIMKDNDSALDLSSGSRDRDTVKSRSSLHSNPSSCMSTHYSSLPCDSHVPGTSSSGSSSSSDNLADLALPDKNASHEVCYVCGDEYKKWTLSYSFAKCHTAKEPFYPSFLRHPRPPRSRPIDPAGRVLTCDKCRLHLHRQWLQFENEDVPHTDRNYSLRKRDNTLESYDFTIFVCYICSLDYHSSCLRLLYCRSNSDNEPYYPFIENQPKPPGASSVSPQGMVQVCMVCYQSIKEKHRGILKKPFHDGSTTSSKKEKNESKTFSRIRLFILQKKKKVIIKPKMEPKSRVRACRSCTTSLMNQWTQFQREDVPVEKRDYTYSSLTSNYRRIASPSPTLVTNAEKINQWEQEPVGGGGQSNKVSTSSSSFYCFLCGLHSELSFSRVLYSSAPAKKAPFFPFMKLHVPKPRAETLREDGTALYVLFAIIQKRIRALRVVSIIVAAAVSIFLILRKKLNQ
ncbi:unnamed protein product [Lepeophtheirus salmonis]|uniref:(salmon louse) hypothetical protein n=1 Tax=Lepeophtheirus salmonis TaxID=72036 RepID=A0A7R8CLU2_LEPSM|nr:unnamed protein product [Lepeophtheirus salmonis]CAF2859939.1 unnamed protein product [Lepeophtheirus salmonis]